MGGCGCGGGCGDDQIGCVLVGLDSWISFWRGEVVRVSAD